MFYVTLLVRIHIRQNFPFGVLLKTIFPDGILFKHFSRGGCFLRKMHAGLKQTAGGTGEFAVREEIATGNGDIAMHREPPVKLASSRQEGVGYVADWCRLVGNRHWHWRVAGGTRQHYW